MRRSRCWRKLNRVDIDALATQLTGLLTDLRTRADEGDVHQTLAEATDAAAQHQRGGAARPTCRA